MSRLHGECWVTEKIDGTNSTIMICRGYADTPGSVYGWMKDEVEYFMIAGSRTRWITQQSDNHGFARWVVEHAEELKGLGEGIHRGEWWGQGIQRGYGLKEKRFSLFNVQRWCLHGQKPGIAAVSWDQASRSMVTKMQQPLPKCCHLVPVLYRGVFDTLPIEIQLESLKRFGSVAAPEFMDPEGVVVFHVAGNIGFKRTIHDDDNPKSARAASAALEY